MSVVLRDLISESKDGDWGRGEPSVGLLPYSVIRATDFAEVSLGNVATVPIRYLPQRTAARRTLQANDILIETAGGSPGRPTGRTMLVTDRVMQSFDGPVTCASFARFLRVDPSLANPEYVYWYLQDLYNSGAIEQYQVQHTGVARFQYTDFASSRRVVLPSISTQRGISEVLGSLDDKIAVNSKVACTAGALVTLRFREAVREVPFSTSTFAEIASVGGGGTPRTGVPDFWNGGVPWATPTDITALAGPYLESTARSITAEGLASCSSPLYPRGSILMTSRATIGAFAIAQRPCAVNQGFIVVNPIDQALSWWLFHEMQDRVDEFISLANGATFLELSRGRFKELRVRLREQGEMVSFGSSASALHDVARQVLQENRYLASVRDTLLPQLMSGRLRVKDAEKQVEAVV